MDPQFFSFAGSLYTTGDNGKPLVGRRAMIGNKGKRISPPSTAGASNGPPLDYSFKSIASLEDLKNVKPRKPTTSKAINRREEGRFHCVAVKLSHNSISSLQGLWTGLSEVVFCPELIGWLDLSFNGLEMLDAGGEELLRLSGLKLLYLHGNHVARLQAIRPLGKLPLLLALTLHGNPLAQQSNRLSYRSSVIALLPQISSLDFTQVTDNDRRDAANWARRHLPIPP